MLLEARTGRHPLRALALASVLIGWGCRPADATRPSSSHAGPTTAASLAATPAIDPTAPRTVDLQGHRGARGLHPENTEPAFAAALSLGVTTLEMDLGLSRDDVVLVHHDERLHPDIARGADGRWLSAPTPALRELSAAELERYDVGRLRPGSAYAARFPEQQGRDGVRIPRFAEIIAMAERASQGTIHYNVETKLSPLAPADTAPPERFAELVLAALLAGKILDRTTVQSFDWRSLRHLGRIAPKLHTSCLSSDTPDFDTLRRGQPGPSPWTAGLDIDAFEGSAPRLVQAAGCTVWSPNREAATEAQIAEAHQLGLTVAVWTVNDPEQIAAMLNRGADAIISDYPDRVRAVLQQRGWPLPTLHR